MSRTKKTPNERYIELVAELGLNHAVVSDAFDIDITTSRRWANNPNSTPPIPVVLLLEVMKRYEIDIETIKRIRK